MQYTIIYSKIKHWYVRLLHDWSLKLSIPLKLKWNKDFEEKLLEKWKILLQKDIKNNHKNIEKYWPDYLILFWEKNEINKKILSSFCDEKIINMFELIIMWKSIEKELKKYLFEISLEILQKFSDDLWIGFNKLTIKDLKSKWGSCSFNQNIVINLNLVYLPKQYLEYVIIHEACHLKEKNHSRKFWNLVELHCPDFKNTRKELKKYKI